MIRHFRSATQAREQGQGLVEYALLLTLVSIAALLAVEGFGLSLEQEYCKVLNALGTTEAFCATGQDGDPGLPDDGTPGESGDEGGPGTPDDGDHDPNPGDEAGPGDNDEGLPAPQPPAPPQESGNPPDSPDPLPGVITLFQVQANRNQGRVWFTAQFNGGYQPNVVLTAYLDGQSKVMMDDNGNKYRVDWQNVTFPAELRIIATDYAGRYADAELHYTITGKEHGRVDD